MSLLFLSVLQRLIYAVLLLRERQKLSSMITLSKISRLGSVHFHTQQKKSLEISLLDKILIASHSTLEQK